MMFALDVKITTSILKLTLKDRFNFLVKGKTLEESLMLSSKTYNLFFSDLDII